MIVSKTSKQRLLWTSMIEVDFCICSLELNQLYLRSHATGGRPALKGRRQNQIIFLSNFLVPRKHQHFFSPTFFHLILFHWLFDSELCIRYFYFRIFFSTGRIYFWLNAFQEKVDVTGREKRIWKRKSDEKKIKNALKLPSCQCNHEL